MIYVPDGYTKDTKLNRSFFKKLAQTISNVRLEGSSPITIAGSVATAEQKPWLRQATIRDLILFGQPFDSELYERTLQAVGI